MKSRQPKVTIEEVTGNESKAKRLVKVGDWELFTHIGDEGEEETTIRDLDLAEKLGYKKPHHIRELIERMIERKQLTSVFRTVRKNTGRGRPGKEYWLTEAQTLKVIAKSETEIADELLDQIIQVFMLARRGLLDQQISSQKPPYRKSLTEVDRLYLEKAPRLMKIALEKGEAGSLSGSRVAIQLVESLRKGSLLSSLRKEGEQLSFFRQDFK